MRVNELLVSSVNITEDEYCYKGLFILSGNSQSMNLDISELEEGDKLNNIKETFQLEDSIEDIKSSILAKVIEKASISSNIKEGENYNESSSRKRVEKAAASLDMA
ncbi:MAG: hypothetical protein N2489_06435 [Clostridia bacterium]|nr:hypothetical protein [Clostridia bacterium]